MWVRLTPSSHFNSLSHQNGIFRVICYVHSWNKPEHKTIYIEHTLVHRLSHFGGEQLRSALKYIKNRPQVIFMCSLLFCRTHKNILKICLQYIPTIHKYTQNIQKPVIRKRVELDNIQKSIQKTVIRKRVEWDHEVSRQIPGRRPGRAQAPGISRPYRVEDHRVQLESAAPFTLLSSVAYVKHTDEQSRKHV